MKNLDFEATAETINNATILLAIDGKTEKVGVKISSEGHTHAEVVDLLFETMAKYGIKHGVPCPDYIRKLSRWEHLKAVFTGGP